MNYLMWHPSSSTTGKVLLEGLKAMDLNIEGGISPPLDIDKLIRWGTHGAVAKKAKSTLNYLNGVKAASDKLQSLQTISDFGLSVPKVYLHSDYPEYPVLGRKVHHTQGDDIILCLQSSDPVGDSEYFVRYVPKKAEYRVHVFKERVLRYSQKILQVPEDRKNTWIWNFENGYRFMVPQEKLSYGDRAMCIAAVEALGLHFGAVDFIIAEGGFNGLPGEARYILEVNTAPRLDADNNVQAYLNAFGEWLGGYPNPIHTAVAADEAEGGGEPQAVPEPSYVE